MGGAFPLRDPSLVARSPVNASVDSVVETAGCALADVDIRGGCEMGASTPVSGPSVLSEWVSLEVESLLPLGGRGTCREVREPLSSAGELSAWLGVTTGPPDG